MSDGTGLSTEFISVMAAFVLALIANIGQFIYNKSQGKKSEAEASGVMIDMALKLNKQELDTLRVMNSELRKDLQDSNVRVKELETQFLVSLKKQEEDSDEIDKLKEIIRVMQMQLDALVRENDELKRN